MRIGLGVRRVGVPGGLAVTQRLLLEGLHGAGGPHRYVVFGERADIDRLRHLTRFELRPGPAWELAAAVQAAGLDVFHGLTSTLPALRGRALVTIHDVLPLDDVDGLAPDVLRWLRPAIREAAARADRVVTVSEHSRREIVRRLGVAPERVSVVANGIDPVFRPGPAVEGPPYVLHVGGVAPRKNVRVLVRAVARMPDLRLVVVNGRVGEGIDPLLQEAIDEAGGGPAGLEVTGQVDTHRLRELYRGAALCAYPSRAEGFGLPPVEAMACGTPVVAARASCLPEVLGDAALFAGPDEPEEWVAQMRRLLTDRELRREMVGRGLARSGRYSLAEMTRRVRELYELVGSAPR